MHHARHAILALAVSSAMSLLCFGVAVAQTAPQDAPMPRAHSQPGTQSTTNGMATEPAAPVGHRQPTESSLTPQVRRDETAPNRGEVDPLGPLPQICQRC